MSIEFDRALVEGRRVLCAVSGGADSMCLLHLLRANGIDVTAAHFEHGIRGAESRRDAAFVENWCRENGVPSVIGHGDVPAYAASHGLGIEEAARQLRYAFLTRAAADAGCDVIATAHTLDDNAETILFHLTRGSGAAGLTGIPRQRGIIVRPLLSVSRKEIEAYLTEHALAHVEDSSNQSDAYTRNRIRHGVLPTLRELNPRIAEAAARSARLLGQDDDCLNALAEDFLRRQLRDNSLPLEEFRALHPAIASRVLRRLLPGLEAEHVDAALRFIQGSDYALLDLPGRRLRREQGRLYLDAGDHSTLPARPLTVGQALPIPEAGLTLQSQLCIFRGEVNDLFTTSFVKYEMISADLLCTGRLPGDRLRPVGRGCTKTLKALFQEAGFTQAQRDLTPVIRDSQGPLWVRGLAVSERAVPMPGDRAVRLHFIQTEPERGELSVHEPGY
ncbi:MAG: tRNA lysidine(34) synthetase TilS [Oscillospiraceae bacterium]|nr:tRNA lysidine(34) synthetase TilS [Oscillospiraceae bacterium]